MALSNHLCFDTMEYKWDVLFGTPSREWISFRPEVGHVCFVCLACRQFFSSKFTFLDHINRRAVLLEYDCRDCVTKMVFYNKCALLMHTRTHLGVVDLRRLKVSSLPIGVIGFGPLEGVAKLYDVEPDEVGGGEVQFYEADRQSRGEGVVVLRSSQRPILGSNLRLHTLSSNVPRFKFVEPIKVEVGVVEDPFVMPVISHVESLNSQYVSCSECSEMVAEQDLSWHFLGDNEPNNLQCPKCPFIAPTECGFKAHVRWHTRSAPFICPECGIKKNSFTSLAQHFVNSCFHSAKNVRFRCPAFKCSKIFMTKTTYHVHFASHLKRMLRCSVCVEILAERDVVPHSQRHPPGTTYEVLYTCLICEGAEPVAQQDHQSHINIHVNAPPKFCYVYVCLSCKSQSRSSATYSSHVAKCSKIITSPERKCKACRSKLPPEQPIGLCVRCQRASAPHFPAHSPEHCILCHAHTKEADRPIHSRSCKYSRPIVLLTTKTQPYICRMCYGRFHYRPTFIKHALQHRNNSSSFQCMECAECFVVRPSLIKHLKHYHHIADYKTYFKENDCGGSAPPLGRFQCAICHKKFDDQIKHDKHFRTHGMAFLLKNK